MFSFLSLRRKSAFCLLALFFCVALVSIFVWYRYAMEEAIEHPATHNLMDYAEHSSAGINQRLSSLLSSLSATADLVAREEQIMNPQVMRILRIGSERMTFDRMAVALPSGYSLSTASTSANVGDKDFFLKAIGGMPNISELSDPNNAKGEDAVVFAAPIRDHDGVRGVLYAEVDRRNFPLLFSSPLFGGKGFSYVVDREGNVIFAPERSDAVLRKNSNIFKGQKRIDGRYEELRAAMERNMREHGSGVFRYGADGETRYLNYAPLGVNDWYLVSVISAPALLERFLGFLKITVVFGALILALFTAGSLAAWRLLSGQAKEADSANSSLEALTANIPGGVSRSLSDERLTVTDISDGYLNLLECGRDEFQQHYQNSFLNTVHPDDRKNVSKRILALTEAGTVLSLEYRIVTANGNCRWVLDRGRRVRGSGGEESFYHLVLDNTEARHNAEALVLSEERYRIVTENADEYLFDWNLSDDSLYFSAAYQRIFGDQKLSEAVHADDREAFKALIDEALSGQEGLHQSDFRMRTLEGDYIWCRVQGNPIVDIDGNVVRVVGIVKDISDQVREREELMMQARIDSLTGLLDKGATQELIKDFLAASSKEKVHAVFICDIDNFKTVNDSFGHLYGDTVLGDLARKLLSTFRGTDIVGRIGGDEFMILMKDIPSMSLIHSKALDIRAAFRQNYDKFSTSGSIGIAVFPQDGTTFEELYQKADTALYDAKKNGKNRYVLYQDIIDPREVLARADGCNVITIPDQPQGQKSYSDNITEYVFKILHTVNEFDEAVKLALSVACRYLDMSRGYIFEYDAERTELGCTFEYCQEGVSSVIADYPMRPVDEYPHFCSRFKDSDIFFLSSPDEMEKQKDRDRLRSEGVFNMLQCVFSDKGGRHGVLGFDDCRNDGRRPTSREIEAISLLADIIGSYIIKERSQQQLAANFRIQEAVIKSLRQWIFVTDSDRTLLYFNEELKKSFPKAEKGRKCYSVLFGRDAPCEQCPLTEMIGTERDCLTTRQCFTKVGLTATVSATVVSRSGEDEAYSFCAYDIRREAED